MFDNLFIKENLIKSFTYTVYKCSKCEYKTEEEDSQKEALEDILFHYCYHHIKSAGIPYNSTLIGDDYKSIFKNIYQTENSIRRVYYCNTQMEFNIVCLANKLEINIDKNIFDKEGWFFILENKERKHQIYKLDNLENYLKYLKNKIRNFETLFENVSNA
jgi:hypothetical protein